MPEPHAVALFAIAALALLVIPEPSVLYIVARSVEQGRTAGLVSVLGVHTGTLVHVAAAAFGLSAILPQFVDTSRNVTLLVLVLGWLLIALGICSDGTYALVASTLGDWLRRSRAYEAIERYVAGGILVALGVTAAVAGGRPTRE